MGEIGIENLINFLEKQDKRSIGKVLTGGSPMHKTRCFRIF